MGPLVEDLAPMGDLACHIISFSTPTFLSFLPHLYLLKLVHVSVRPGLRRMMRMLSALRITSVLETSGVPTLYKSQILFPH